jgi:hypothetical protein
MDIAEEIIDDACNGYVINIQLISFNKKQQQVKWPLKLRKLYLLSIHNSNFRTKEKSR